MAWLRSRLLRASALRQIERWIDAAAAAGLIAATADRYRTLTLTPHGRDVMAGRVEDVRMVVPAAVSRDSRTKRASRKPGARRRRRSSR